MFTFPLRKAAGTPRLVRSQSALRPQGRAESRAGKAQTIEHFFFRFSSARGGRLPLLTMLMKLVGRGMMLPECLTWEGDEDSPNEAVWSLCNVVDVAPDEDMMQPCLKGQPISEDVARDLIALHSLRWLSKLGSDKPRIYKPTIQVSYYEHDDDMVFKFIGVKQDDETMVYHGSVYGSLSEALIWGVINSTEHLEPK